MVLTFELDKDTGLYTCDISVESAGTLLLNCKEDTKIKVSSYGEVTSPILIHEKETKEKNYIALINLRNTNIKIESPVEILSGEFIGEATDANNKYFTILWSTRDGNLGMRTDYVLGTPMPTTCTVALTPRKDFDLGNGILLSDGHPTAPMEQMLSREEYGDMVFTLVTEANISDMQALLDEMGIPYQLKVGEELNIVPTVLSMFCGVGGGGFDVGVKVYLVYDNVRYEYTRDTFYDV